MSSTLPLSLAFLMEDKKKYIYIYINVLIVQNVIQNLDFKKNSSECYQKMVPFLYKYPLNAALAPAVSWLWSFFSFKSSKQSLTSGVR